MGDVLQGHRFKFAIAKQTAEGSAASTAEYAIPGASLDFLPREERVDYESLDGNAYNPGQYKSRSDASGVVELFSIPGSLGRLVTAHLGQDTVTGTTNFTHTIISNNSPHWNTCWLNIPLAGGSSEWLKMVDTLVKSIDFQYTAGRLMTVRADLLAKKAVVKATAPTITTTEELNATTNKHTWAAPTLKLDLATTPASTSITNLASFVIHLGYDNATFEQTDQLTPTFRDLGRWTASFSAEFLLSDWTGLYTTFYGAAAPGANTDPSITVLSGSLDFTVGTDPVNANRTLQIQMPAVEFAFTAPTPDRSGKGLRSTVTGSLEKPASGEPVTVIVKNGVSADYDA